MDLLPTSEQDEIVSTVRAVLADRHQLGEPLGDELWSAAAEQGWFLIGLPESAGGVGYSIIEESLVMRELGTACAPGPFLATVLAAHVAALAGNAELTAAIGAGSHRVALAERLDPERFAVQDLPGASLVLVVDEAGIRVVDAAHVSASAVDSIDELVPVAYTDGAITGEPLAALSGDDAIDVLLDGALLVAAGLAGLAEATVTQSVAYGKDREQFGQPIGAFQAVKHRCADMATRAEIASCQVAYAAITRRDRRDDAAFHVDAARIVAARAAIDNSQVNVQNHGGIGFTWEHTAHRFVTRARVWSLRLGSSASHQSSLLARSAAD